MRILYVTHQYAPAIGGAERYVTSLSASLAARGHRVDVVTSRARDYLTWRNELPAHEVLDGVNVYRIKALRRRRHTWWLLARGLRNHRRWPSFLFQPLVWYGNGPVCPGLATWLLQRAGRYDIMHINNLHYAHAYPAFIAARRSALPIVLSPLIHAEQRDTYDVGYMRTMLARVQAVLALTPAEKRFLQQNDLARRVEVGGVGLETTNLPHVETRAARARFGVPDDAFVILFLGRKTAYKGLDACLAAFHNLRQRRDNVVLLAVGPETDYSQGLWAEERRRHGALDNLIVRGAVDDGERLAALAAGSVLVVPSTGESFGIVFLEAWVFGKPVIGARIRAVESLVSDGREGFLIEPEDEAALTQRITRLVDDPELCRRLGAAGREKLMRRYTSEHIAIMAEALYRRVLRHAAVASRG